MLFSSAQNISVHYEETRVNVIPMNSQARFVQNIVNFVTLAVFLQVKDVWASSERLAEDFPCLISKVAIGEA
jgi:hypothetical protein